MPRYFFHLHDGVILEDREGTELPDRRAAWSQAAKTCGEMLRDLDGQLHLGREWQMEVRDETGGLCWRFRFSAEGIPVDG